MAKININLFLLFFSFGCHTPIKNEGVQTEEMYSTTSFDKNESKILDSLIFIAVEKGDFKAYNKAFIMLFHSHQEKTFLLPSIIMANKYNCPEACYNVYCLLVYPKKQSQNLNYLDKRTKNIALYYLLKSYELNYDDSKYSVNEIFSSNKTIPKSSEYANFEK